jgi:hypothetical protein
MKRVFPGAVCSTIISALLGFVSTAYAVPPRTHPKPAVDATKAHAQDYQLLVKQYCIVCHNEKAQMGNLMLDKADLSKIPEEADIWEKVERKLRSNMMPPQGMPRPDAGFSAVLRAPNTGMPFATCLI